MGISRSQADQESGRADWPESSTTPSRVARDSARGSTRGETEPVDALWSVREVSPYLRVPISSIYKMTAKGAAVCIPHIHIGGKLRFRRTDVDHWLSLLTVSNIETLARARERALEVTHGHYP